MGNSHCCSSGINLDDLMRSIRHHCCRGHEKGDQESGLWEWGCGRGVLRAGMIHELCHSFGKKGGAGFFFFLTPSVPHAHYFPFTYSCATQAIRHIFILGGGEGGPEAVLLGVDHHCYHCQSSSFLIQHGFFFLFSSVYLCFHTRGVLGRLYMFFFSFFFFFVVTLFFSLCFF